MSKIFNLDEFEDFLGDDDSDGYRLAEFLRKKNENARNPQRFIDFEIEPVNVSSGIVKIKPLSEKSLQTTENFPKSIPAEPPYIRTEKQSNLANENKFQPSSQTIPIKLSSTEHVEPSESPQPLLDKDIRLTTENPTQNIPISTSENSSKNMRKSFKSKIPQKKPSSEIVRSSVHKSGGVSPGDHLRRYTFKRLTAINSGGRSLLKEFERTVSNNSCFAPEICSTPIPQNVPYDGHSPPKIQEQPQLQEKSCTSKFNPPPECKSSDVRESISSAWKAIKVVSQKKLSNEISTTQKQLSTSEVSPGRTYTIEKNRRSGQILLTPTKEQRYDNGNDGQSQKSQQNIYVVDIEKLISPKNKSKYSTFNISPCLNQKEGNGEEGMILDTQPSASNTPTKNNSNAGNTQISIVIPETQEQEPTKITGLKNLQNQSQNLIESLSINTNRPVIVMPIQQTFNATTEKTVAAESLKSKKIKQLKETKEVNSGPVGKNCTEMQLNQNEKCPEIENLNNLKLADILTDDEDEHEEDILNNKSDIENTTNFQNSAVPLNLVSSLAKKRKKVKKAEKRQRLELNESKSRLSSHMLPLGPRPAHVLNLDCKSHLTERERRSVIKIALNRVPCTPKNGEKCAAELKKLLVGLTNREILDLRKRNSCGRIFQLKGDDEDSKKSLLEKQDKLEKEINLEIEKRNIENEININNTSLATTNKNEDLFGETNHRSRSKIVDIQRILLKQKLDNEKQKSSSITSNDHINSPVEKIISTPIGVEFLSTNENSFVEHLPLAPSEELENVRKMVESAELAIDTFRNKRKAMEEVTTAPKKSIDVFATRFSSTTLIGNDETVSFAIPESSDPSKKKRKSLPEALKKYMEVKQQSMKRKRDIINKSKRSLYTKGQSDNEETIIINPPEEFTDHTKGKSSISLPKKSINEETNRFFASGSLNVGPNKFPSVPEEPSTQPSASTQQISSSNENEIILPPAPFRNDEDVFKKPLLPAPQKRRYKKSKKETVCVEEEEENNESSTVRRSQRGHIPRVNIIDYYEKFVENEFSKAKELNKRRLKELQKSKLITSTSTQNSVKKKETTKKNLKKSTKKSKTDFSCFGDTAISSTKSTIGECRFSPSLEPFVELDNENEQMEEESRGEAENNQQMEIGKTNNGKLTNKKTLNKNKKQTTKAEKKTQTNKTSKNTEKKKKNQKQSTTQMNIIFDNLRDDQQIPTPLSSKQNDAENNKVTTTTKNANNKYNEHYSELGLAQLEILNNQTDNNNCVDIEKNVRQNNRMNFSHIELPTAPMEQLNNIFNQLRKKSLNNNEVSSPTSSSSSTASVRKLTVRVKRLKDKSQAQLKENIEKEKQNKDQDQEKAQNRAIVEQNQEELLTWLKGIANIPTSECGNFFQNMRYSSGGNLMFIELEGIDYAFYDTKDKTSLGYIRFKPRQQRPPKRAKKYNLHFIVIGGEFKIHANDENGIFHVGDMIAINKGCRYSIENNRDDIGILMVIKK